MPIDVKGKEDFVSGHSGTSWLEVLLITCVFPCAVVFFSIGCKVLQANGPVSRHIVGSLAILLPTLLSCWRSSLIEYVCLNLAPIVAVLTLTGFSLQKSNAGAPKVGWSEAASAMHEHPKTYVAIFRAGLTMYTCIAILAVDFPYFPRRLAKAETFGTGLMDLGPGLYVFSFGLMLGLRMQRKTQATDKQGGQVRLHNSSNSPRVLLLRATRSVGPLAALGFARMILTKAVEYQEHHSEYGVHWNFFFTLASVACFTAVLPLSGGRAVVMAATLMILYQGVLLAPGWTEWLASDQRDRSSIFDSNKEGLMSLFGYAALCNLGAATAAILHENNSITKRVETSLSYNLPYLKTRFDSSSVRVIAWNVSLFFAALFSWMAAYVLDVLVQPVSRRFANSGYVMWVFALALTQLQTSVLASLLCAVIQDEYPRPRCSLVDGLSTNQLAAFLVANVATGAVNILFDTLRASEVVAFSIMIGYCLSWAYIGNWVDAVRVQVDR